MKILNELIRKSATISGTIYYNSSRKNFIMLTIITFLSLPALENGQPRNLRRLNRIIQT